MRKLLILGFVFLCSCVSVKITEIKPHERYGAGHEHLEGRLYQIDCSGDDMVSKHALRNRCLHDISKLAHGKQFEYFVILSGDVTTISYVGVVNGMPITSQAFQKEKVVLLIQDDEITRFNNFYRVSDYFPKQ